MAENLQKKPAKGILKNSKSFDQQEQNRKNTKETKWDEMNIIATLHPADKDYGHMKIDEPKTPYERDVPDSSHGEVNPEDLAEKLRESKPPKVMEESEDEESEEDEELTPEQKELKKDFEMKRKAHYNEYYAVKLARKLLEEEEDEDTEEDETAGSSKKK